MISLFDVYPLLDVTPQEAKGSYVTDINGKEYLDFYGGHAVISIGHSHPHYINRIQEQLNKIGFYSNSVKNPLQEELANKISQVSGVDNYGLWLCNSGTEAVDNALKMASFKRPGTNKVLTLPYCFHGRTSAAINVTDNEKIKSQINRSIEVAHINLSDLDQTIDEIAKNDTTAVILETIQGVGGLDVISAEALRAIDKACKANGTVLIMDEVQSGFGRSGYFFAYQYAGIEPDIITMAKGMGNGFPIGGILLNSSTFKPFYGMLGSTFGGNHLACAAALAVLDVIEEEKLIAQVPEKSKQLASIISSLDGVKKVKGMGLMIGAEFEFPIKALRTHLVTDHFLMTGSSKDPNVIRLLPSLTIDNNDIVSFENKIRKGLQSYQEIQGT